MRGLDDAAGGRTTGDPAVVTEVLETFESLQMDALSRGQSRDVIAGFAEELWNVTATGVVVRDTTDRAGATLSFPPKAWQAFTATMRAR